MIRALNRERYGDITRRTKIAFEVLCERQKQSLENPSTESFAAENAAMNEWKHYAEVEEQFFRQKSRIILAQVWRSEHIFFFIE